MTRHSRIGTIAVLAVSFGLITPAAQAQDADAAVRERYVSCLDRVQIDPEGAYEDALIWRGEGGGVPARHCVALALLGLGRTEEAAARLESAALAPDGGQADQRAEMLSQAGNAWLLAEAPLEAQRAFDQGLAFAPGDPDLLIDRARAFAMQERASEAESDLTLALGARPYDALALRLRADARLSLGRLEEALTDITRALDLAPDDIETLVVRGRIREALRLASM